MEPLVTPLSTGCGERCVCCEYRARTSVQATTRCYSGKNKTQTFSKREQTSSSMSHECPAPVQPATRVYPTSRFMGIIKQGYLLQFARRPLRFSGVVSTSVQSENAHVLRSEVMILLEKGVIERVPPAQSDSGFSSRYFLFPKKDGGLRTILDLRCLN